MALITYIISKNKITHPNLKMTPLQPTDIPHDTISCSNDGVNFFACFISY